MRLISSFLVKVVAVFEYLLQLLLDARTMFHASGCTTFILHLDKLTALTHWGRVTHICVWNNIPILLQITACHLLGAKPLYEPVLPYCQLYLNGRISVKFSFKEIHLKMSSTKVAAILPGSGCIFAQWYVFHQSLDVNIHFVERK